MKVLGVIPARSGSKGIKKKNIKLLRDKPLINYSIESSLVSNLNKVVVSTDCIEIIKIAKRYNLGIIKRSPLLAKDRTPTLPVIQDVLKTINSNFDAVMVLQPTSPFRTDKHINESIELFKNNKGADSLVSVVEVPHNFLPEKLMDFNEQFLEGDFMIKRRQEMHKKFARNGAIYLTKIDKISSYLVGGNVLPYFMDKMSSIDIDDIDDWIIAERLCPLINN